MAAAITGILNHLSAGHPEKPTSALDVHASGASDNASQDNSASITANDFLTLLVTEMKNQDPTAQTDPNEYINQLVQVNSLQQLISINETLKAKPAANPKVEQMGFLAPNAAGSAAPHSAEKGTGVAPALWRHAGGNLTVPETNLAAHTVAQALGHRPHR